MCLPAEIIYGLFSVVNTIIQSRHQTATFQAKRAIGKQKACHRRYRASRVRPVCSLQEWRKKHGLWLLQSEFACPFSELRSTVELLAQREQTAAPPHRIRRDSATRQSWRERDKKRRKPSHAPCVVSVGLSLRLCAIGAVHHARGRPRLTHRPPLRRAAGVTCDVTGTWCLCRRAGDGADPDTFVTIGRFVLLSHAISERSVPSPEIGDGRPASQPLSLLVPVLSLHRFSHAGTRHSWVFCSLFSLLPLSD